MELHLFIIWSNAYAYKDKILSSLKTRLTIIGIHEVTWAKKNFSKNLTRFYGENLPKNSNKERLCGNSTFTLVVVRDDAPLYKPRMTSKGLKIVNVNIFDSKEMFRVWTGGGHLIHGTNSTSEFKHDLVLLTGLSSKDYFDLYIKSGSKILTQSFTSMPGENGWENIAQVLYVMNETLNYVVLRNFDGLFSDYNKSIHGDVDVLSESYYSAKLILNGKEVHRSKKRVKNFVCIGDGGTFFDIRYVGDNYYDKKWEEDILETRILDGRGFYKASNENFLYGLLYHALIQKKKVSEDYYAVFNSYFKNLDDDMLLTKLKEFLDNRKYSFVEPLDYSVFFSSIKTGKRMSLKKIALKSFHKIFK